MGWAVARSVRQPGLGSAPGRCLAGPTARGRWPAPSNCRGAAVRRGCSPGRHGEAAQPLSGSILFRAAFFVRPQPSSDRSLETGVSSSYYLCGPADSCRIRLGRTARGVVLRADSESVITEGERQKPPIFLALATMRI
jgi:hypothetical protein